MGSEARSLRRPPVLVVHLLVLGMATACVPPEIDSFVTINVPSPMYRFQIAKHIRASELWRAYVEHLSIQQAGNASVVSVDVTFEREITKQTGTGDYDEGVVHAELELKELVSGSTLLTDRDEFEIPNYVIVREDATRAEVQDAAFAAVEEKAVKFIVYSLDLAIVRAMGKVASQGEDFIPALKDVQENHWSVTLSREAGIALEAIQGPKSSGGVD